LTSNPQYIWLIGDTGAVATDGTDQVLHALKAELLEHPGGAVIFLGDLVYPHGMPEQGVPERSHAEAIIQCQIDVVRDYPGKVYFLSGNHDWKKGSSSGWKNLRRLETFIHEAMGKKDLCVPVLPGPGPELVEVFPCFHLIFLNTQWWMQPGIRNTYRVQQFFLELESILNRVNTLSTLICGHHPLRSHSMHGGKFKKRHHVYPLTFHGLPHFPLPGVGSLWLMYRKFIGAKEDMASPRYSRFREMLLSIFERFSGLTYASGHEHTLQWIQRNGIHHLVSGAGSKSYYVREGKGSRFAGQKKGFFRLDIGAGGIETLNVFEQSKPDSAVILTHQMTWQ
jgi:hypothetical protein